MSVFTVFDRHQQYWCSWPSGVPIFYVNLSMKFAKRQKKINACALLVQHFSHQNRPIFSLIDFYPLHIYSFVLLYRFSDIYLLDFTHLTQALFFWASYAATKYIQYVLDGTVTTDGAWFFPPTVLAPPPSCRCVAAVVHVFMYGKLIGIMIIPFNRLGD